MLLPCHHTRPHPRKVLPEMPTLSANFLHGDSAERIAQEYQDFAYIVSHDLSAPLRHIREFTRLLVDSRSDLGDDEREYIQFLETSLHRLDVMQAALLGFARIGSRAGEFRETDCNSVVESVLNVFEASESYPMPVFECGVLPVIMADPDQIQTLFYNLIDNALKFRPNSSKQAKILISALKREDSWMFKISDNGIGIEKKYHEEIFRMFRRLEPEKYPGVGAGLTIARKIARRHGGDMFVESTPGKGTSVFFSIATSP